MERRESRNSKCTKYIERNEMIIWKVTFTCTSILKWVTGNSTKAWYQKTSKLLPHDENMSTTVSEELLASQWLRKDNDKWQWKLRKILDMSEFKPTISVDALE